MDVSDHKKGDSQYFSDMIQELEDGGYSALLTYLLNYEILRDIREVPHTQAMVDSKIHSMTPVQSWWHECLVNGYIMEGYDWENMMIRNQVFKSFHGHSKRCERTTIEVMTKELRKLVSYLDDKQIKRKRCWGFPPLDECSQHFEQKFKIPIETQATLEESKI